MLSVPMLLPVVAGESKATHHHSGGPHAVREGKDGYVYVCLKGNLKEEPQYDDPDHAAYYAQVLVPAGAFRFGVSLASPVR